MSISKREQQSMHINKQMLPARNSKHNKAEQIRDICVRIHIAIKLNKILTSARNICAVVCQLRSNVILYCPGYSAAMLHTISLLILRRKELVC